LLIVSHFVIWMCFFHDLRINRPGGTGRITKIHYASNGFTVESIDVKYTVSSGFDHHLSPDLILVHQELDSRSRRRVKPDKIDTTTGAENEPNIKRRSNSKIKKTTGGGGKLSSAKKRSTPPTKKKVPKTRSARKVLQQIVHAVSPRKGSRAPPTPKQSDPRTPTATGLSHNTGVPREIFIHITSGALEPNSLDSQSRPSISTSLSDYSPLGVDGVESQPIAPNSNSKMVCHSEKARVGKSFDHEHDPMDIEINGNASKSCSPRSERPAKVLATGSYFHDESGSCHEEIHGSSNPHMNLLGVFDHGIKKAHRFIGDLVSGSKSKDKNKDCTDSSEAGDHTVRLNHFQTLLSEVLFNCDGMLDDTMVGEEMRAYAAHSGDDCDFTEQEIKGFLSQLCTQNKIMRSQGMLYNLSS
jgi:hypothetical protein